MRSNGRLDNDRNKNFRTDVKVMRAGNLKQVIVQRNMKCGRQLKLQRL